MPKPITTSIITFLFFAVTLTSCKNKEKDDEKVISGLESSLISSNQTINRSTETVLKDLEEKAQDYCTMERAQVWLPKANSIVAITKELYDYFEALKQLAQTNKIDYLVIENKLENYRQMALSTDSTIREEFHENFQFINRFENNKFSIDNVSERLQIAVLCMLQNEIKNIENKTISFCNNKVGCTIMTFDSYSAIVGQNSSYLKPGTELEIKAGVGALSKSAQPVITINNKNIELGPEGYSLYKMKTPKAPGNYRVPVRIKYFNKTTGKEYDINVNVEYTVVKECDQ